MPSTEPPADLDAALVETADRLYAVAPQTFVPMRDAAARSADSGDLTARIRQLRRPTLAAWAVNLLVRREADQIEQVLAIAESLREAAAALDGDELRNLTRQRRQLTAALTASARSLVAESGTRLTAPVSDQVEAILTAAMLDPVAARVLRSGMVLTAFTATGVSEIDVDAVCAVPIALGHRASRIDPPADPGPPTLRVVPDTAIRREAAQERVTEAVLGQARAREESRHQAALVETLRARRLQLHGEMDELRRRLAALEEDEDQVDRDIEDASEALAEAAEVAEAAEDELEEARRELARLEV